jgi:protein-disulfide isomerase-like protein with CxxC motif
VHGWTKEKYCEAFGLERGQSLEGPGTRKLRAAALTVRLVFDPAIREGSAAGRKRAAAGDLTRDAARAARGRPFPEQRRRKAAQAGGRTPPTASALAAAAEAARLRGQQRHDAPWRPALDRLGYADVATYLRDRHLAAHRSVNAIAAEVGVSYHAVESALRRHGLDRVAHADKRHAAQQRAARVAAALGFETVAAYVAQRRSAGWTWQAMATESGQPQTWLRRHAASPADRSGLAGNRA